MKKFDHNALPGKIPVDYHRTGKALVVIGLIVGCYFFFMFDTTVETERDYIYGVGAVGGQRVYNIGRMQDRNLGCLVSLVLILAGAVMVHVNRKSPIEK